MRISWSGFLALSAACDSEGPLGTVSIRELGTIGAVPGDELPSMPGSMARWAENSFILTFPWKGEETPHVYSSSGRLLRTLGRIGAGPGEARRPTTIIVDQSDTVYIFDRALGRLTTYTPDLSSYRITPFPQVQQLEMASSGLFVGTGLPVPGERQAYLLRQIDRQGTIVSTFGRVESLAHRSYAGAAILDCWLQPLTAACGLLGDGSGTGSRSGIVLVAVTSASISNGIGSAHLSDDMTLLQTRRQIQRLAPLERMPADGFGCLASPPARHGRMHWGGRRVSKAGRSSLQSVGFTTGSSKC